MMDLLQVTLKGFYRDRIFQGILVCAALFVIIPFFSTLSMRQVTELSIILSLSFISFLLFILAVFLGGTSLWKDIERKYSHAVLSLPLSRSRYVWQKFAGISAFLLISALVLSVAATVVIYIAIGLYPPDRPVMWGMVWGAVLFDALKYILLVALSFLFSTVSTSFFLPIFGTITIFLVGSASQQVFDYVQSPASKAIPPFLKGAASLLYYILPNFSAFDLKVNAIYTIQPDYSTLALTVAYFVVYTSIVLVVASWIFSRKELL